MDFFEDEATSQPAAPPKRRSSNRRRTQVQRIVALIVVLFLVVFGLVLWVRSCQLNNKKSAYRTYFANVSAAITDSNNLGKQLNTLIVSPTRFTSGQLSKQLSSLQKSQQEIATRVKRFSVPDKLKDQQYIFTRGMDVRLAGFTQFGRAVLAAAGRQKGVSAAGITSLSGYFTGPDAYYNALVYTQARQIMQSDGVTDVAVPNMTYFESHADLFSATRIASMLTSVGQVSHTGGGGVHGVALVSVVAQPSNVHLVKGARNPVKADVNLAFTVTMQNQGTATEANVPVTVTLSMPGQQPQKVTKSIASIAKSKTQSIDVNGFNVPTSALTQVSSLKVTVGPVPGEKVTSNNGATYQIILNLAQ